MRISGHRKGNRSCSGPLARAEREYRDARRNCGRQDCVRRSRKASDHGETQGATTNSRCGSASRNQAGKAGLRLIQKPAGVAAQNHWSDRRRRNETASYGEHADASLTLLSPHRRKTKERRVRNCTEQRAPRPQMTVLRVSKRSMQVVGKGSVLDVLQVITEIFLSLFDRRTTAEVYLRPSIQSGDNHVSKANRAARKTAMTHTRIQNRKCSS